METTHTTKATRRKAQRKIARIMGSGRATLNDIGVVLGVPPSTVYRWSKGSLPRAKVALAILERVR